MAEAHLGTGETGVEWILDLSPIPMIRGSASQIRSLLAYLIQNAHEAMPKGKGRITFTTQVDERNWVILEVRDSGCGMTNEVLKRTTEPFFTTKAGRSGIGLTVAHGIWRRHRGALSIESEPGQGTLIRLAVEAPAPPAAVESHRQQANTSAAEPQLPSPPNQPGSEVSPPQPNASSEPTPSG